MSMSPCGLIISVRFRTDFGHREKDLKDATPHIVRIQVTSTFDKRKSGDRRR